VLLGGSGNDRLHAGSGHESLYGHGGNDVLTASAGHGVIHGGAGADTFVVRRHARYGLFGEDGNDRFFIYNTPRTLVAGGPGNDIYYRFGRRATRNIVELPSQGTDTLYTDHSMRVPLNVEIARATGRGDVSLFGNSTTQSLHGGAGHDRLVAGTGNERLVGGRGDTTFLFAQSGHDVATGGSGQNWFVFRGTPLARRALLSLRRVGGNQITNFKIGRDHLVLRAKALGSVLIGGQLMLVEGRRPTPTAKVPTLMFNTSNQRLSFDPDGTGPNGARILVTLANYHRQVSSARERGKYRIHSHLGSDCLPVSAFSLTR
jgi:Ca2+-binding RTX toxin-like protein